MTTDWRALCVDLVAWADYTSAHYYVPPEVLVRARAALAEPEPEGPTDAELRELWNDGWDTSEEHGAFKFARAVLARWGTPNLTGTRSSLKDAWAAHQPAIEAAAKAGMEACRMDGPAVPDSREPASVIEKPSDGEVAELVRKLREQAAAYSAYPDHAPLIEEWARCFTRAADLLEQRHLAPVPVLVSERLPGPDLCWWFESDEDCGYGSNWTLLRIRGSATGYTHWLPAHALPLPTTETQP